MASSGSRREEFLRAEPNVKLPEGRVPITCKWLFNEGDGEKRYKARFVACGFSQKKGVDYAETYSPIARLDTVRVMLAVAHEHWMASDGCEDCLPQRAFGRGHLYDPSGWLQAWQTSGVSTKPVAV